MRNFRKFILVAALALVTALAVCITGFAKSDDDRKTRVGSIRLKIDINDGSFDSTDDYFEEDDLDGMIYADDDRGLYSTECKLSGSGKWYYGRTATVRVTCELDDPDSYKFSGVSKDDIRITSGTKYLISKSIASSSSDKIVVSLKLRAKMSSLDEPDNLSWDGHIARWDEVGGADQYTVYLYRGASKTAEVTTTGTSYNLYPGMREAGKYKFRVKAYNKGSDVWSSLSDMSDELSVSSSDVYTGTDTLVSDTAADDDSGEGYTGWNQDSSGWAYAENGRNVKSRWKQIDGTWYYFGDDGYMQTGWLFWQRNNYYLNPVSDGTKGAMKTGWLWDPDQRAWFYLNETSDGTKGAVTHGYRLVNGRMYYLDPGTGALWMNERVPNGKYAGADGAINGYEEQ